MNAQKFESLIHRFFGQTCLEIDLFDNNGKYTLREWFIVPLEEIEMVVSLVVSGKIVEYTYDTSKQKIVLK